MPHILNIADVGVLTTASRRPRHHDVPSGTVFEPRHAVRCVSELRFRTQAARDLASFLDLDPDVVDWACRPPPLERGRFRFVVDLAVTRSDGTEFFTVVTEPETFSVPAWASETAAERGATVRVVPASELIGDRLVNARELLRYAK